jgi:hypothetical protein
MPTTEKGCGSSSAHASDAAKKQAVIASIPRIALSRKVDKAYSEAVESSIAKVLLRVVDE